MLTIVSDTSVISNFLHLQRVDILNSLYERVLIPNGVGDELSQFTTSKNTTLELPKWLEVVPVKSSSLVAKYRSTLDQGEAEAITLAQELQADYLLIDEVLGRKEAEKLGITILGTLGILLQAKSNQIITEVDPYILALKISGFWISKQLHRYVLQVAGEAPKS
ncbi:MAG: DUF3368 domain-containing protein [Bacteroidia bacterium]|nr:DUF3368 domain-containing protein [Bacteroidia bacterium]